jgi:hypothetical protein
MNSTLKYHDHVMKKALTTAIGVVGLTALSISSAAEPNQTASTFSTPMLMAESGKNICQPMTSPDGNPSAFELCVANGLFAHDVYTIRTAGVSIVKGIDDETTNGINGLFYGNPIHLKCEPISQFYDKLSDKEIEDQANSLNNKIPNSTFEERKQMVIAMNMVEIGRHCTLSNSNGIAARLDVKFPE